MKKCVAEAFKTRGKARSMKWQSRDQTSSYLPCFYISACDCHTAGSQGGGLCDALSGQCLCKENVDGQRCDRCKHGFFNLREDNLAGCQGGNNYALIHFHFDWKYCVQAQTFMLVCVCVCACVCVCLCGILSLTVCLFSVCRCHILGSIGSCDQLTGSCHCDHLASGLLCDRCVVGLVLMKQPLN